MHRTEDGQTRFYFNVTAETRKKPEIPVKLCASIRTVVPSGLFHRMVEIVRFDLRAELFHFSWMNESYVLQNSLGAAPADTLLGKL